MNRLRLALLASAFVSAAPLAAQAADTLPRAEVEGIVKDYLLKNPDVVIDSIKNYQAKEAAEAKQKATDALKSSADAIFNNPADPVAGNPKGDVTLVEFFDYHCGYCKHVLPTITQLIKDDPKLRVVFKEFPILSEDSRLASKAALAVNSIAPAKYFEYHTALMGMSGKFTEANLAAAAVKLGVNEAKFKEALKNPELDKQVDKDRDLAQKLGISGTPALVLKNEIIPGAVSIDEIKTAIKNQREGKLPAAGSAAAQ